MAFLGIGRSIAGVEELDGRADLLDVGCSSAEGVLREEGKPLTAGDALGLSKREREGAGDVRPGKPGMGDVLPPTNWSFEDLPSSGTDKLALVRTGEDEGDSFGKRCAALKGDARLPSPSD